MYGRLGESAAKLRKSQRAVLILCGYFQNLNFGYMKLDGILLMGDNFYDDGVINSDDARFEQTYLETFRGPYLKNTKIYVNAGNHDYHQNITAQIEYKKGSNIKL